MFEHLKMKKQLKQQLSKVLSIALSVAMLVGTIPADMLGGIADVKAAAGESTLSASAFTLGGSVSDSANVFTSISGVTVKTDDADESDTSKFYFELSGASITFNVATDKKGTLSITKHTTAGEGTLKCDGTAVSGTTVTDLAAGPHTLTSEGVVNVTSLSLALADVSSNPDTGETVTVSVTLTGDSLLSDTDKITFTADGDSQDITKSNSSVTLKKGTEYTIGCTNANVKATTKVGEEDKDTVTFSEDGNLTINLAPKAGSTYEATVSISDAGGLITGGAKLSLICVEEGTSETAQDLTDGDKVTLTAGNKYKIDPDSIPSGAKAELTGADANGIITATATTLAVTVTADDSGEKVNATITLDKTNAVLDDVVYKITLVNKADVNDVVECVDGTTTGYKLAKNATYEVKSSVDTVRATVHGATTAADKTTVTTAAADVAVQIDLATKVEATVTFSGDKDKLPTGAAVKLTNKADAEDIVTLTDGGKANLWIGDEYTLSCSDATVTAKIADATSLTVAKTTNAITVAIKVTEGGGAGTVKNTYVLDATTIPNGESDGEAYADGAKLGTGGYFSVVLGTGTGKTADGSSASADGSVTKKNSSGTNLTAIVLNKYGSASVKFTVKGTADTEIEVASTGGSNYSSVALLDKDGNIVAPVSAVDSSSNALTPDANGVYFAKGTSASVLKYEGLEAGEYYINSPSATDPGKTTGEDCNRGMRLIKATVDDTVEVVTTTEDYVFDATAIPNGESDGEAYADGAKLGTGGYFSVVLGTGTGKTADGSSASADGSVTKKNSSGTNLTAIVLNKYGSASVKFTVKGTAGAEIEVASTGGSNYSSVALLDKDGNIVAPVSAVDSSSNALTPDANGVYFAKGTSASVLKYEDLEAGEYYINSPSATDPGKTTGEDCNRGMRLIKATVSDTFADSGDERKAWSEVDAPKIKTVAQDTDSDSKKLGTITVTATGVIGDDGADKIEVTMYKVEGEGESETETRVTALSKESDNAEGADFTLQFTPASSGKYRFKINAIRSEEENPIPGASKDADFSLPLATPENFDVRNIGEGKIKATWDAVFEAEQYVVKAVKASDNSPAFTHDDVATTEYTSTESDALTVGETYLVSVAAKRGEDIGAFTEAQSLKVKADADAAKAYWNIDLESGLFADRTYADGDLTVLENMPLKDSRDTIDGVEYPRVQGNGNPSPNAGAIPTSGAVVKLAASKDGKFTVATSVTDVSKTLHFIDVVDGAVVDDALNKGQAVKTIYKFDVKAGHTYYFYGDGTKVTINLLIVDYRSIENVPWSEIPAPGKPVATWPTPNGDKLDKNTITVTAKGLVGSTAEDPLVAYADALRVDMLDSKGDVAASKTSTTENTNADSLKDQTFEFEPTATDSYTFVPYLVRSGEEDKRGEESDPIAFELPLAAPVIASVTNKGSDDAGKNKIEVVWSKVSGARSYEVTVYDNSDTEAKGTKLAGPVSTTALKEIISGLDLGKVTVGVVAIKGDDKSAEATKDLTITGSTDATWAYASFGPGAKADDAMGDNGYEIGANGISLEQTGGTLELWSRNKQGKILPGSTDGLAYYYTTIDPNENFILEADVHVKSWEYSNGQEGFGIMAADRVGVNGDRRAFWNNSYQLLSSKIQYKYNLITGEEVSGSDAALLRYDMQNGLGWTSKLGTTITDVAKIDTGEMDVPTNFVSTSGTLETSMLDAVYDNADGNGEIDDENSPNAGHVHYPRGTYNLIGNRSVEAGKTSHPTIANGGNGIVDFKLRMVRTNSGYYLTYITTPADPANNVEEVSRTQFFADANRSSLAMIDKKNVYLGFFASRNVTINVSNVHLTTGENIDVSAYEKPVDAAKVDPDYQVTSSEFSNSRNYDLIFKANADGKLNITDSNNKVIASDVEVTAGKVCTFTTRLSEGTTTYTVKFEPNKDYKSSAGLELKNYDPVTITHPVTYRAMSGDYIYADPDGTAAGDGTSASPVDIRTAIAYAAPGQTIRLKAGNYMLGTGSIGDAISIDKGHNGTPKKPITMEADPAAASRPVLDFAGQFDSKSAFVIAGDYWRFKGFDVTNSKDGEKAIQLSGDYNILEDLHTYRNGNTGIQISRLGSEGRVDWPSYNKVVNCTSYLNADSGYEDADGFAAKLTVGEGNEFIGCIAAYNADDGWDLYAKVEDGSIGAVTIDRCIAFKNGYDIVETAPIDTKKLVETVATGNGTLYVVDAGNGNGFKLGGESMSGYHVLKNSIAFGNKLKGIDCNSCPDIQVFNCTSYKNIGENVSLYTKALNTDYYLDGVISVSGTVADEIKPVGTQNLSKIYSAKNYLYAKGITYRADDKKQTEAKVAIEENGSVVELTAPEWFKSTAMETVVADWKKGTIPGPDSTGITRDANGNIVMRDFLELKPEVADALGKGATVGSTDSVIEDEVVINAYAGTVTTLNDISLTAVLPDYSWKYPATDLTAFVGTSSEFIAIKDGRDRAVTVNLIDITGVELKVYDKDGNEVDVNANTVQLGDNKLILKAVPVVTPAIDLESDEAKSTKATFKYELTDKTKLGLNTTKNADKSKGVCEAYDVTRKADAKDGAATITATMTVTLAGTRSKTVKKTASYSFISRKEASKFSYTLTTNMDKDNDFVYEDAEKKVITNVKAKIDNSFTLTDLKVNLTNDKVKVSVSDSKVLKLDASTNTFTAKAEGTATITLTAVADKTVSEKILVNVRGAEIKLNASMITLDQAKYTGTQITATPLADITLTGDIKVEEAKLGNNDSKSAFTLKRINGNIYSLIVGTGDKAGTREDSTTIANGTYKVRLSGTYTVGTGESAVEKTAVSDELLVRVMTTRPTVSIRQQKRVNIFYKYNAADAAGTLTATSKLAKVTLDTTAKAGDDFELTYSGGSYTVTMKKSGQDKLEANNLRPNTLNKRITTTASFGGYKSTYDQPVTINVATERRLPVLVVEADNDTLYTKLGIKDTEIRIFNKTNKTYLTGVDVTLANSTRAFENANKNFWLEESAGAYVLTTSKSGTAKISVKDADWNEEIVLNQRLTLNDRTVPRPVFSAAKLNSGADYVGKEQASSVVTIRGILDYKIRDLKLTAKANTPAAKLLPALVYDSEIEADEYGNHLLNISLDEDKFNAISPKITRGSFTYTANFRLNNLKDQTANVTVTILPVESITMTARQSGKIDLLNRAGTAVTVKPVMKNLNGTVSGMYFKDDAHNQFDVAWDSAKGAAIVTAKEYAEFRQSGRYKVTPVFEVWTNNGKVEIEAARPIFITTTQSSVKTTSIPLLEMRLADPSATAQATLAPKSAAEILDVTQVTNLQNFKVEYDAQGDIVSVQIIDRKGLKAGSTYRITVELQLEGSAVNAKPQKVNIPVKVLY